MSSTKELIIEKSADLFATYGYEKTSVALILQKTGLSKGGFYHHFKSKEEILEYLTRSRIDHAIQIVDAIVNEVGLSAVDKLNKLFEKMMAFRKKDAKESLKIFESYLKDENLLWRKKMDEYTMSLALNYYVSIVNQGIEEGFFKVSNPGLTAELIIREAPILRMKMISIYLNKANIPDFMTEITKVAIFIEEFIHRILGARSGLLNIKDIFVNFFKEI
jgi:AcrR family transcriptional regulator